MLISSAMPKAIQNEISGKPNNVGISQFQSHLIGNPIIAAIIAQTRTIAPHPAPSSIKSSVTLFVFYVYYSLVFATPKRQICIP